jgi:hypothetical protein
MAPFPVDIPDELTKSPRYCRLSPNFSCCPTMETSLPYNTIGYQASHSDHGKAVSLTIALVTSP